MHAHWKKIAIGYGIAGVVLYFINQPKWGITNSLLWPMTLVTGGNGT